MAQIKLSRDAGKFVAELSRLTGLNSRVLAAQLYAEEGNRSRPAGHPNDHNWLNVGNTDSKWYPTGGAFRTPEAAARTTAKWIKGQNVLPHFGRAAPGIQAILRAGKNPQAQINAIARSGWATDPGYGNTIRSLYGQIGHYASRSQAGVGASPRTAGVGAALPAVAAPSLVSTPDASTGADPAELLRAQGVGTERKAQVTGTSLALPAFAAAAVAPQGGTVEPAAVPAQTDPAAAAPAGIGDLLKQLPTLTAAPAAVSPVASAQSVIRAQRAALTPPAKQQQQAGTLASALDRVVQRANTIDAKHMPYLWGGGHAGGKVNPRKTGPLDCSGAVSAVLGINTRVSGELASWGRPGRGKHVTIYANPTHTIMEINGHFFGTSGTNKGGGAGWIPRSAISSDYLKNFTARHPAGM